MLESLIAPIRRLRGRSRLMIVLALVVVIVVGGDVVGAKRDIQDGRDSYLVCVDKNGSLYIPTGKKLECKKGETAIELPYNETIELLGGRVADQSSVLELLENAASQQDSDIAALLSQMETLGITLPDLQAQVTSQDSDVAALLSQMETLGITLPDLQAQVTSQDSAIASLLSQMETLGITLPDLQAQVTSQDSDIAALEVDLQGQVTNQASAIGALLAQMATRDTTIGNLETRVGTLENPPVSFVITASADAGGSILPNNEVIVREGESQAFTITPDDGYGVLDVVVDGAYVGPHSSFTFASVAANHTIHALFTGSVPTEGLVFQGRVYTGDVTPPVGLEDVSPYGNDGTFKANGEPDWVRLSSGLWVLEFDGADDVVTISDDASLQDLGPVTISVWINPTTLGEYSRGRMYAKEDVSGASSGVYFGVIGGNRLEFRTNHATQALLRRGSIDSLLPLGVWKHAVVTWTGSGTATTALLYLQGAEVVGYSTSNNGVGERVTDVGQDAQIGNDGTGSSTFDGDLALLRIYNRVLSPAEIAAIYESEKDFFLP